MYRIRSLDRTPLKITQATLRSHYTSFRSGHITRDKRKIARLAIFPNFLRYAPKTSLNPDVIFNRRVNFQIGVPP